MATKRQHIAIGAKGLGIFVFGPKGDAMHVRLRRLGIEVDGEDISII